MSKKTFAAARKPALSPEQEAFIKGGRGKDTGPANANEPTQRLSVDLPKSLHTRFKVACALADTKMVSEVMAFIEQRTAEIESRRN